MAVVDAKLRMSRLSGNTTRKNTMTRYWYPACIHFGFSACLHRHGVMRLYSATGSVQPPGGLPVSKFATSGLLLRKFRLPMLLAVMPFPSRWMAAAGK
jgi:hypothetical protein